MYRGDEISALVVDLGSHSLKAGFAGDDTPQCVIPTDLGLVYSESMPGVIGGDVSHDILNPSHPPPSILRHYVDMGSLNVYRSNMEIISPIENGIVADWTGASKLIDFALEQVLRVDPKEHPILLGEPAFNPSALREKATELFFECCQVPAFFLCKNPVLSSFAHGRSTSVVLESGGGTTVVTPVHNGYALTKSIVRSPLAGDELTRIYSHILSQSGIEIQPEYMLRKKETSNGTLHITRKPLSGIVTNSFHSFHVQQVVQSLKEGHCHVYETAFDETTLSNLPPSSSNNDTPWSLPNHQFITPGTNKYRIPEIMFNPNEFIPSSYPGFTHLHDTPGIHQMLLNSISACDSDIRKDLFQNIVISGGNTLFNGFHDRLLSEVNSRTSPQKKLKNQSLPSNTERKYSVFIGGSILGCLGSFHLMWISKQEYEEHGRSIVDRKCP